MYLRQILSTICIFVQSRYQVVAALRKCMASPTEIINQPVSDVPDQKTSLPTIIDEIACY